MIEAVVVGHGHRDLGLPVLIVDLTVEVFVDPVDDLRVERLATAARRR